MAAPACILTQEELRNLGQHTVVYVKPERYKGAIIYGIYSADGQHLAHKPCMETAIAVSRQSDFSVALVH
jgi:hypothetical protein